MSDGTAERKAQTRAMFDRIAPEYDAAGPGCFAHYGRRLVEEVGIAPGMRVLDVATGRGAALIPAAEAAGADGAVVGIDLSEAMVQAARGEAARRGLAVDVRVMDAERLDFPDGTSDRVLCAFALAFFPDLPQALAEFHRVLRPGGRVGVSTWRVTQTDDLETVLATMGLPHPESPPLREPVAVADALAAAGFANVRARVETATFRYADLADYWRNARGTGVRRALDGLDTAQTARVMDALAERVRSRQRDDGIYLDAAAVIAVGERP